MRGFESSGSHQVNRGAEMHREIFFELKEGEESNRPGKLDEDVDVTRFGLLTASNRPKDADPADREPCGDIIFEVSQDRESLFPGLHGY